MPMQQRSDLTPPLGGGMKGYFPFWSMPLRFHVFLKKCVLPILIAVLKIWRLLAIELLP